MNLEDSVGTFSLSEIDEYQVNSEEESEEEEFFFDFIEEDENENQYTYDMESFSSKIPRLRMDDFKKTGLINESRFSRIIKIIDIKSREERENGPYIIQTKSIMILKFNLFSMELTFYQKFRIP